MEGSFGFVLNIHIKFSHKLGNFCFTLNSVCPSKFVSQSSESDDVARERTKMQEAEKMMAERRMKPSHKATTKIKQATGEVFAKYLRPKILTNTSQTEENALVRSIGILFTIRGVEFTFP